MLRIFAGTCALLWLAGIVVCGIERVCNCADHGGVCAAHASPVHEPAAVAAHEQGHSADAEHHHDADVHQHATASHDHDGAAPKPCAGKNGCEDKRCCSTIQALIPTMTSDVISKPVSQPALSIPLFCAAPQQEFAAPASETLCQATPRDWFFTPEVCLGPAFHSLAPPVFL